MLKYNDKNPCADVHTFWNSYYIVGLCCLFLHLCSQIYEKHLECSDIPTNVLLKLYFFTTKKLAIAKVTTATGLFDFCGLHCSKP